MLFATCNTSPSLPADRSGLSAFCLPEARHSGLLPLKRPATLVRDTWSKNEKARLLSSRANDTDPSRFSFQGLACIEPTVPDPPVKIGLECAESILDS
jgi:hypothetical protein